MPPKKASPIEKVKTAEFTTKSAKGRDRQSSQRTNNIQDRSGDKTPIKSGADKVSKKASVSKNTANHQTPENDTVNKATVVPANYKSYPKALLPEAGNKTAPANFKPHPKTLMSEAGNKTAHKPCAPANYKPHPKTLMSEAGNKTAHKPCAPANFKPHPKTLMPEAGNKTAHKPCDPVNFKPYPRTSVSETGNNTSPKAHTPPAYFKSYPNTSMSEINKDDQLIRRNASELIDHSGSNTSDKIVHTRSDLCEEYSSRAGEFKMNTIQNEGKDSKIHVDNVGDLTRRVENLYVSTNETTKIADDTETALKQKVYKDNRQNRALGRVGKPVGSAAVSKKTKSVTQLVYSDTARNRQLGRVGKPRGSLPAQNLSATTKRIPEILDKIVRDELEDFTIDYDISTSQSGNHRCTLVHSEQAMIEAFDQALCLYNRTEAELSWQRQSEMPDRRPKTLPTVLEDYVGKIIPFSDLKLYRKIGQGGFGEVYFAKWSETIVAVKKLKQTQLSDEKINKFKKEIMNFCSLQNPNIVKFIGACTELPHICVVMEYMQMSLFDAIHVRNDVDFSDIESTSVVKQVCDGVKYLHASRIAHCDLKTMNVLLDYVEGEICEVKIADFGLSIVKACASDSSSSSTEVVRKVGTPRYSAPEVLLGEFLTAKDMMKADVYSLSLVLLEVLSEQEPFPNYGRQELFEQVGQQGKMPEIPDHLEIDHTVMAIMQQAWSFNPQDRPDIGDICDVLRRKQNIHAKEIPLNIFA